MKRAFSFLAISLFIAIRGAADPDTTAPATAPARKEFISQQYHLRLKYSADWVPAALTTSHEIFSVQTPHSSRPEEFGILNLRLDHGPPQSTDPEILLDLSDALASFVFKNGGQHVKIKPEHLRALPARRITFTNQSTSGPIEALYIVAVKDRVEYVFYFAAPARTFDGLLSAVNEMLNSFEILD